MKNILFLLLLCSHYTLFATNFFWIGGNGDWEVAANWSPNGLPEFGDNVFIYNGTVRLSSNTVISRLSISLAGTLNIEPSGELTIKLGQSGVVLVHGVLNNKGGLIIDKEANAIGNSALVQLYGSVYNEGFFFLTSQSTGLVVTNTGSTFSNYGSLELRTASGGYAMSSYGNVNNKGSILIESSGFGWNNFTNLENWGFIEIECGKHGLVSSGRVDNHGVIDIHVLNSLPHNWPILNEVDFINHPEGSISLRGGAGLRNTGSFANSGELSVEDSGFDAIINLLGGDFTNTTTGQIHLSGFGSSGINNYSQQALFKNQGDITITNAPNADSGLRNESTFRNLAYGTLTISASCKFGVENVGGTFLNKGKLYVSGIQGGGIQGNAIRNISNATFRNWNGGLLEVQSTTNKSILNELGSTFDNSDARLFCAEGAEYSIHNEGFFHNRRCGEVRCPEKILNKSGASLINDAFLYTSFSGQHENEPSGDITNNGVIEDLHDAFGGVSMTNNGIVLSPVSSITFVGQPVNNALGLGGFSNATVVGWWVDGQGSISAGTYNAANNNFTPNNDAAWQTKLYVEIDLNVDKDCKARMLEIHFQEGIKQLQPLRKDESGAVLALHSGLKVFPNPCPGSCEVIIRPVSEVVGTLSLYASAGQLVWQSVVAVDSPTSVIVETEHLTAGTYWLRWITAQGNPLTAPLVIAPR